MSISRHANRCSVDRDDGSAGRESVAVDEELRSAVCGDGLAVDYDGGWGRGGGGVKEGDGGAAYGDVGGGWGEADGCAGYGDCGSSGRECLAVDYVVGSAVGGEELVSDGE